MENRIDLEKEFEKEVNVGKPNFGNCYIYAKWLENKLYRLYYDFQNYKNITNVSDIDQDIKEIVNKEWENLL